MNENCIQHFLVNAQSPVSVYFAKTTQTKENYHK